MDQNWVWHKVKGEEWQEMKLLKGPLLEVCSASLNSPVSTGEPREMLR